ncbi:hypothetical protein ACFYPT_38970 [Streptomyces sp. NPDC005529]|uniref:hypothetical protein n=1 Tax=unclassified Streptomyces TaxID=2593676 RepID=UPI0033B317A0
MSAEQLEQIEWFSDPETYLTLISDLGKEFENTLWKSLSSEFGPSIISQCYARAAHDVANNRIADQEEKQALDALATHLENAADQTIFDSLISQVTYESRLFWVDLSCTYLHQFAHEFLLKFQEDLAYWQSKPQAFDLAYPGWSAEEGGGGLGGSAAPALGAASQPPGGSPDYDPPPPPLAHSGAMGSTLNAPDVGTAVHQNRWFTQNLESYVDGSVGYQPIAYLAGTDDVDQMDEALRDQLIFPVPGLDMVAFGTEWRVATAKDHAKAKAKYLKKRTLTRVKVYFTGAVKKERIFEWVDLRPRLEALGIPADELDKSHRLVIQGKWGARPLLSEGGVKIDMVAGGEPDARTVSVTIGIDRREMRAANIKVLERVHGSSSAMADFSVSEDSAFFSPAGVVSLRVRAAALAGVSGIGQVKRRQITRKGSLVHDTVITITDSTAVDASSAERVYEEIKACGRKVPRGAVAPSRPLPPAPLRRAPEAGGKAAEGKDGKAPAQGKKASVKRIKAGNIKVELRNQELQALTCQFEQLQNLPGLKRNTVTRALRAAVGQVGQYAKISGSNLRLFSDGDRLVLVLWMTKEEVRERAISTWKDLFRTASELNVFYCGNGVVVLAPAGAQPPDDLGRLAAMPGTRHGTLTLHKSNKTVDVKGLPMSGIGGQDVVRTINALIDTTGWTQL